MVVEPYMFAGVVAAIVDAATVWYASYHCYTQDVTKDALCWLVTSLAALRVVVTLVVLCDQKCRSICLIAAPAVRSRDLEYQIHVEESCNLRSEELSGYDKDAGIRACLVWVMFNILVLLVVTCVSLAQTALSDSAQDPPWTLITSGLVATGLYYLSLLSKWRRFHPDGNNNAERSQQLRDQSAQARAAWAAKLVSLGDALLGVSGEPADGGDESGSASHPYHQRAMHYVSSKLSSAAGARFLFRRGCDGAKAVISIEDAFVTTLLALLATDKVEDAAEHLALLDSQPQMSRAYLPQILTFLITEADGGVAQLVRQWVLCRSGARNAMSGGAAVPVNALCRAIGCACGPVYFAHAATWFVAAFHSEAMAEKNEATAAVSELVEDINAVAGTISMALLPLHVQQPSIVASEVLSRALLRAAPRLVDALVGLGRSLVALSPHDRQETFRAGLRAISAMLPDDAVYLPVPVAAGSDGCCHYRVRAIHVDECTTFNAHAQVRVPFLVCFEVIDYDLAERERLGTTNCRHVSTFVNWSSRECEDTAASRTRYVERLSRSSSWHGRDFNHHSTSVYQDYFAPDREHDRAVNNWTHSNLGQWSSNAAWGPDNVRNMMACSGKKRAATCPHDLDISECLSVGDSSPKRLFQGNQGYDPDEPPPPPLYFKERWADKEARLRRESSIGGKPGWRLLPLIVKTNDDLRHEELAAQLVSVAHRILLEEPLVRGQARLRPYGIAAVARDAGIVEAIPDTISLDALRQNDPAFKGLLDFFVRFFLPSTPDPTASISHDELHSRSASRTAGDSPQLSTYVEACSARSPRNLPTFAEARKNFVCSLAPYCVVCYLLQLKDRHNANVLLDVLGHLVHIDFGFVFSSSPGRNMQFESHFKLTTEMVQLIGADESGNEDESSPERFAAFRDLCSRCFLALRRHSHQLTILVDVMAAGHRNLSCWQGKPDEAAAGFRERFHLDMSDTQATDFMGNLIDEVAGNWRTTYYDCYQRCCVGIL